MSIQKYIFEDSISGYGWVGGSGNPSPQNNDKAGQNFGKNEFSPLQIVERHSVIWGIVPNFVVEITTIQ